MMLVVVQVVLLVGVRRRVPARDRLRTTSAGSTCSGCSTPTHVTPSRPGLPQPRARRRDPVALLLTLVFHRLRPGWIASVAGRIRWRWMLVTLRAGVRGAARDGGRAARSSRRPGDPADSSGGAERLDQHRPATSCSSSSCSPRCRRRGRSTPSAATSPRPSAGCSHRSGRACPARAPCSCPRVLFALAHGAQDAPVFVDRFAFGLVVGDPRDRDRWPRGGDRDARAQQLPGLRLRARLQRHDHRPEPHRRQLVVRCRPRSPSRWSTSGWRSGRPAGWASSNAVDRGPAANVLEGSEPRV